MLPCQGQEVASMPKTRKADARPAFQFYYKDWLSDTALRCCSLAARGLWMDMLCIMWTAPRRGYLETAKGPILPETLARMVGATDAEAMRSLCELDAAGVYETDSNGTIYCRRMMREACGTDAKSEAGRRAARMRWGMRNDGSPSASASASASPSASASSSTTKPVQGGAGGDSPAAPDVGVRLAKFLQAELKKHHPRATPTAGYLDADALRIIAPRIPEDQLLDLIRWAAADPHWGPVLLARGGPGVKLREHFDTLHARWASRASARPPEPSAEQRQAREATEAFKRRWRQQAASDAPATAASDLTAAGPAIDAILERLKEKSPKIGDSEKAE